MKETCSLDIAERGGITLEEIGLIVGLTRERVRQIEMVAMRKVRKAFEEMGLTAGVVRELLQQYDTESTGSNWPDLGTLASGNGHPRNDGNGALVLDSAQEMVGERE
jgi:hypothetical protein